MGQFIIPAAVFVSGYLLNIFYITVLYHRGLTHESVLLRPWMLKFVGWTGIWITGIDPKAWACMHRRHHMYSDTQKDPHSPQFHGVFGVALSQLKSYERTLGGLLRGNPEYTRLVTDVPFDVSALNRKKLWMLPYLLHLAFAFVLGFLFKSPAVAIAYYIGIMSHPLQGWMVNALAHKYGYRNFETKDYSTNHGVVSFLTFGEGYQNNHHARPKRANFAIRAHEFDFGYALCLVAAKLRMLDLRSAAS